MQKITPHLWFDKEAKEAAGFCVASFGGDSEVTSVNTLHDTPSGDVDTVSFRLRGSDFLAISAGPHFKINPSISFFVWCESAEEVDRLWQKFSPDGKVLMPLDSYPFSKRYGWIDGRYGVSWQLTCIEEQSRQKITPCLMFANEQHGRAEEAIELYTSIFPDSRVDSIDRYGKDQGPEGKVVHGRFSLAGVGMAAMDSHEPQGFTFNEAVSLMVSCKDQDEIDYFWEKLTANGGKESMCGWLKDKYGVSWQIVPAVLPKLLQNERAVQAMLKMKKFDIAKLKEAHEAQ